MYLDWRGRTGEENDRARDLLRQGHGLHDRDGFPGAWLPKDHTRSELMVRREPSLLPLLLQVTPTGVHQADFALELALGGAREPLICPSTRL